MAEPGPGRADRVLTPEFFGADPLSVARSLLGQRLVRVWRGRRVSGLIVEAEAYFGETDSASHAYRGPTPRNAPMYLRAGHAYIYLVYGMHHMLNVVTGAAGEPSAVLIRSVLPLEGADLMLRRRQGRAHALANGPGKLCEALAVSRRLNGLDLTFGKRLWIEAGVGVPESAVRRGPRVGIDYALPRDREAPFRLVADSQQLPVAG